MMIEAPTRDYEDQAVRASLVAISEAASGVITPEAVVAAAADASSPLHGFFDWDNDQAAAKFRLVQAGALIRRVKLTIIRASVDSKVVEVKTTRAFVAPSEERKSKANPEGGYSRIEHVMSDDDRRAALINTVKAELAALRRKYESLSELSAVWKAIATV